MWLWKKFWNTDIIGKTYILIILFIVIVATITVITRYKNDDTNQVINEQQNEFIQEVDVSEQNIISDDAIIVADIEENIKDEIIEETSKDTTKNNVETQEKTVTNRDKTDNKSTERAESKEQTKVTVDKEQINNDTAQINKKDEVKQEEQQAQEEENKQQEQGKEQKEDSNQEQQETNKEDKQEIEEKEDTTTQEVVRTVKRNDTYIQKMKNYITTNDKSNYSIVVDESIVNNTYGFTYSEFNMSGYLGCYSIYRIYAQDYYVNGEYVETRCYVD